MNIFRVQKLMENENIKYNRKISGASGYYIPSASGQLAIGRHVLSGRASERYLMPIRTGPKLKGVERPFSFQLSLKFSPLSWFFTLKIVISGNSAIQS
jgi:hypothetical protein